MKKIKVYAYTRQNLGDDLFIKILCERYPNTQFVLYAPNVYKDIFKDGRADAALAASLFHYGELTINEVKKYLKENNVAVRTI